MQSTTIEMPPVPLTDAEKIARGGVTTIEELNLVAAKERVECAMLERRYWEARLELMEQDARTLKLVHAAWTLRLATEKVVVLRTHQGAGDEILDEAVSAVGRILKDAP